jgi:hypothetical protein
MMSTHYLKTLATRECLDERLSHQLKTWLSKYGKSCNMERVHTN